MTFEQNSATGEPGADASARALEAVVQRASRRQKRFARITAASFLVAVTAVAVAAATLLNRAPAHADAGASSGPAPLTGGQAQGNAGMQPRGAGPDNTGGIAQPAYFSRTTPTGVRISATPLFVSYQTPACQGGEAAPAGTKGGTGSAPAATAAVLPESGTAQTIASPPGSTVASGSAPGVPYATTPLETLPPSGSASIPKCEPAPTFGLSQLKITVSYGSFTGAFLSNAGLAGGSWIEQAYTLPDGSRLVAASVGLPSGTSTAALQSVHGTALDGPVGPTTGYAGPYSSGGWAILAVLLPASQNSNAAPALSLELQLGTSSSLQLSLPVLPASRAAGADGISVSGTWHAPISGTPTTPQG